MKNLLSFDDYFIYEKIKPELLEIKIDSYNETCSVLKEVFDENDLFEAINFKDFINNLENIINLNKTKINDFKEKHNVHLAKLEDKYKRGKYAKTLEGFKKFYEDNKKEIDTFLHYAKPFFGGFGIMLSVFGGPFIFIIAFIFLQLGFIDWMKKDYDREFAKYKKSKEDKFKDIKHTVVENELITESTLMGLSLYMIGVFSSGLLVRYITAKRNEKKLRIKIQSEKDPKRKEILEKELKKMTFHEKYLRVKIIETEKDLKKSKNISKSDLPKRKREIAEKKIIAFKKDLQKLENDLKSIKEK